MEGRSALNIVRGTEVADDTPPTDIVLLGATGRACMRSSLSHVNV